MAPFLAVYFQDTGPLSNYDQALEDQRLTAAVSEDGITFRRIGRILTNAPITRDTSILPPSLAPDGRWHLACGNSNLYSTPPNNSFDHYSGESLMEINPNPQTVSCAAAKSSGTVNWAWAPEWFKDSDGTVYVIVSTSTHFDVNTLLANGAFTTWAIPATNDELTEWGTPIPLDFGASAGLGFIDTYVVKLASTYYAFTKFGDIQMRTGPSFPGGPWTLVHTGSTITTPDSAGDCEGQNVLHMGGSTWRVYYDKWAASGTWKFSESTDNFATFNASQAVVSPDRLRHGHVIDLDGEPPLSLVATGGARRQVAA
jgi:hypothetical protein